MLLILAAGATIVAAATQWVREHPGRLGEEFKEICKEASLELRDASARTEETVPDAAPLTLTSLDTQYQRFIVEKVDPLVSRTRRDQLAQISSREVVLSDDERALNRYLGAALLGVGAAAIGLVFPPAAALAVGAALFCAFRLFRRAYDTLVHERKVGMTVMGSLYIVGAFAGGFILPGMFGLFVWYLSEKLLLITQDRSQHALISVFGEQPRTAWVVTGNKGDVEVEVPIETIQAGDIAVIQAGQIIPVDGIIVRGMATVDQHILTGESQPVEKGEGDRVLTSTLMVGGKVYVRVEKTGEETIVAQIGAMLNNTASYQASIVSKGQQVADASVPPTMVLALIALPLSGYRYAVAILGSSIGLNIRFTAPISMLNVLNVAANHNILIKDGRSLELLSDVDLVIFDKTGTLTMEQPEIAGIHTCDSLDADTVLRYAAAAEHRQTHPIARAILDAARDRGLTVPAVDKAHYEIGFGIQVRLDDRLIRVGSTRYMDLEGIDITGDISELIEPIQERSHALVMVAVDDEIVGAIELQPRLRTEVVEVVRALRERNLDLCIISGDQEEPTRAMAAELEITRYFANTLPEEKAALVTKLQSEGHSVCFVGDGINDSISLKSANVSVSLRGASTAATDSAQIVLMDEGLFQLPFVFQLAQEFNIDLRAGFGVAVGQGILVVGGALFGFFGIVSGTLIWTAGLTVGLGIAHLTLWRHGDTYQPPALGMPAETRAAIGPGGDAKVYPLVAR